MNGPYSESEIRKIVRSAMGDITPLGGVLLELGPDHSVHADFKLIFPSFPGYVTLSAFGRLGASTFHFLRKDREESESFTGRIVFYKESKSFVFQSRVSADPHYFELLVGFESDYFDLFRRILYYIGLNFERTGHEEYLWESLRANELP